MLDEEKGKSLPGYLADMSDDDFRVMISKVNMTTLLNIQQMLHAIYSHTVRVKDALIQAIINEQGDAWAASDTVTRLHTILLKTENRYILVKDTLKRRDLDSDSAYKRLRG